MLERTLRAQNARHAVAAARRVLRLIRDLRRRNEIWADGDTDYACVNPDVAMFDRHGASFAPMQKSEDLLTDVVAAIIAEEINGLPDNEREEKT